VLPIEFAINLLYEEGKNVFGAVYFEEKLSKIIIDVTNLN